MSQWVQFPCTCYQPKAHSLNEKLVSASLDHFISSYSYEKNVILITYCTTEASKPKRVSDESPVWFSSRDQFMGGTILRAVPDCGWCCTQHSWSRAMSLRAQASWRDAIVHIWLSGHLCFELTVWFYKPSSPGTIPFVPILSCYGNMGSWIVSWVGESAGLDFLCGSHVSPHTALRHCWGCGSFVR